MAATDRQPIQDQDQPDQPVMRSRGGLGLSGKLLLLTVPLVMIAAVLLYVPAIANFWVNRLNDRVAAANTAALVLDAAPLGMVPDSLSRQILKSIEQFNRGLPSPEKLHVVLLGDVVDRGPASAQLLQFLRDWAANTEGQVMLQGNHEELMLKVHAGERRLLRSWLQVGGRETLEPVPR